MISPARETAEVFLLTAPSDFTFGETAPVPYHRVKEIYLPDGHIGQSVRIHETTKGEKVSERQLQLPPSMADGIMTAARIIKSGEEVNCHRFSRFVVADGSEHGEEMYDPLFQDMGSKPRVNGLPVGTIGLVGVDGLGVVHSIVGLGEDSPDGIQVMSNKGEIGIVPNEDILAWYRAHYARIDDAWEVGLYSAPLAPS